MTNLKYEEFFIKNCSVIATSAEDFFTCSFDESDDTYHRGGVSNSSTKVVSRDLNYLSIGAVKRPLSDLNDEVKKIEAEAEKLQRIYEEYGINQ